MKGCHHMSSNKKPPLPRVCSVYVRLNAPSLFNRKAQKECDAYNKAVDEWNRKAEEQYRREFAEWKKANHSDSSCETSD